MRGEPQQFQFLGKWNLWQQVLKNIGTLAAQRIQKCPRRIRSFMAKDCLIRRETSIPYYISDRRDPFGDTMIETIA